MCGSARLRETKTQNWNNYSWKEHRGEQNYTFTAHAHKRSQGKMWVSVWKRDNAANIIFKMITQLRNFSTVICTQRHKKKNTIIIIHSFFLYAVLMSFLWQWTHRFSPYKHYSLMNTFIYDFQEPRYISLWEFQQETMIICHAEKRDGNLYTCHKHSIYSIQSGSALQEGIQRHCSLCHTSQNVIFDQTIISFLCVLLCLIATMCDDSIKWIHQ